MANINNIEDVKNLESWDVGVTIHRTNPFPLDNSSYFTDIEDAQDYATNGATSYVGQELFVITEVDGSTVVDTYVIQNSDGLLEKIATKSVTDKLSADIAAIFDDVRGGVNYKGHINLDEKTVDSLPKYPADMALSSIFAAYFNIVNPTGEYIENKSLNNGWLYNITTSKEYVTGDGISLENNDYIIIHSHELSCVDVSAITRENIDLIEAVQNDYVRFNKFEDLSVNLSTEIQSLSTDLSIDVSSISTNLSTDLKRLSSSLSTEVELLSAALSNEITALSGEVYEDLSGLSSTVNNEYVHISGDSGIGALSLTSDLSVTGNLTLGSDSTFTKVEIKNNGTIDYTTDNTGASPQTFEIALQTKGGTIALTSDIEALSNSISATAHKEVEDLSASLSSSVNSQFVHLSGDEGIGALGLTSTLSVAKDVTLGDNNSSFKFNVNSETGKLKYTVGNNDLTSTTFEIGLQSKDGTVALTSDIDDLSTTIDEHFLLSSEAVEIIQGTLIDRINALSDDIIDNKNRILSNDDDINYLSAQLSTVADDHYYKTLSSIYHDDCPDNLLVTDHTDELHHKNYVMLFKYGTLVLSSIS